MKRKKSRVEIGVGNHCPKCSKRMKRYKHPKGWVPKKQTSYFRFWDKCLKCRRIQLYEAARVWCCDPEPDEPENCPDPLTAEYRAVMSEPRW